MNWITKAEPYVANMNQDGRSRMLKALATENDLAESLGFEYEPDDKRGYGWGKFTKSDVKVWQCVIRAKNLPIAWARAQQIDGRSSNHRYFGSLEDALRDINPKYFRLTWSSPIRPI